MKTFLLVALTALALQGETLHYVINWQSGLNLGEAALTSNKTADGDWTFNVTLDAAVPGYTIRDSYKSATDAKLCSSLLEKTVARGTRKSGEKLTFDQQKHSVKRETSGGGQSQQSIAECAHDALSFLQFVRQELAQGRLVANQPVYLGAKYDVQLAFTGMEAVRRDNKQVDADKVRVSVHGPKSDTTFELLFARDAVRTPLLARLPLSLGTFTVELEP
jgi:hypothetical protein